MSLTMTEPSVTRHRVEWATVPRVNLLPPEILEARAFARTRRMLAGVVGGVIVLGGLGTLWANGGIGSAQDELDAARARTATLQAQQRQYAEVPVVALQLDQARAARSQAMGRDVLWYRFLDELATDSPGSVSLATMRVSLADKTDQQAATDALTAAGYGDVQVTGQAQAYTDIAKWMTSVVNVTGMELSRLQTAELANQDKPSQPVNFTADVRIAETALSHRFDGKAK